MIEIHVQTSMYPHQCFRGRARTVVLRNQYDRTGRIVSQEVIDQRWNTEDEEAADQTTSTVAETEAAPEVVAEDEDHNVTEYEESETGTDYDCYHPSRYEDEDDVQGRVTVSDLVQDDQARQRQQPPDPIPSTSRDVP